MSSKFISKKLIKELKTSNKFSKPIIKVSIASIAISMLVMIISISVVKGFQKEIKYKVVNFSSHFQITAGGNNFSFENSPIISNKRFIDTLSSAPHIKHIQTFATKPGLIQSKADTQYFSDEKIKIIRDIEGIIFKGINTDFSWEFLSQKIVDGTSFSLNTKTTNDSILISTYISKKLKLKINDPIACYFIKDEGPRLKKFIVSGIYETGLEEFDKQFAFIDIKHIQKLNDWGIETNLFLQETTNENGAFIVSSITSGGSGNYIYNWGKEFNYEKEIPLTLENILDTTIKLNVRDYNTSYDDESFFAKYRIDSALLRIKVNKPIRASLLKNILFEYDALNDTTRVYKYDDIEITTTLTTTGGTSSQFVGGYEVFIDDFDYLDEVEETIYMESDPLQKISKITTLYQEIFGWLDILDTNVFVIIFLMILVSIINIISLMLVLIIERSNMIGLLKAFGAENIIIQRIFISIGWYMLFRGLLIGNAIALLIIYVQNQFGILSLPQENYYLNQVPMSVEWVYFIGINLITIVISYTILFFISLFISTIKPIKSIKFN